MYLTPAEPAFLLFSIILTNPVVDSMSQAKPRRQSNPKLVQRLPLHAVLLSTAPWNSRCIHTHKLAFINPRFVRKKTRFCWCWVHYIKMPTGPVSNQSTSRSTGLDYKLYRLGRENPDRFYLWRHPLFKHCKSKHFL